VYVEKEDLQGEDGRTGDGTRRRASKSIRNKGGKSWETVALDG
jgi:hypothetical protein